MNLSISRNGSEIGEWTEEHVRVLYSEGQLLPTDYYWKEGMSEWKELGTFLKPPLPPARSAPIPLSNETPSNVMAPSKSIEAEENRLIALGIKSVTTMCNAFVKPLTQIEKDLSVANDSDLAKISIEHLYVVFFENAEHLETSGADDISRIIINETTRSDIKIRTYNAVANELKSDAFQRFIQARLQLQGVLNELGLKYQSVSTTYGMASGALAGGVISYAAGGGRSGVRGGAVAGALIGTTLKAAQKTQLQRQLQEQGLQACLMLLDALPSFANSLFDQFIIYTLVRRPSNNLSYRQALKQLHEGIANELVSRGKNIINDLYQKRLSAIQYIQNKDSLILIFLILMGTVITTLLAFLLTRSSN